MNESPSKIACMKRGRYMYVPNPVHACDGYAACMTFNSQLTIDNSAAQREQSQASWTSQVLRQVLNYAEPARNLNAEHYNSRFFDEKGVF